jgi:hypothetical protein
MKLLEVAVMKLSGRVDPEHDRNGCAGDRADAVPGPSPGKGTGLGLGTLLP